MELIIYVFLFLILFYGVIFNLKITNIKKVAELRNKVKDYSKKDNQICISKIKIQSFHLE